MNQPSKTAVQARVDRINNIQRVQVSPTQDQVSSPLSKQQHAAENSRQKLNQQYQHFFDVHHIQLVHAMGCMTALCPSWTFSRLNCYADPHLKAVTCNY